MRYAFFFFASWSDKCNGMTAIPKEVAKPLQKSGRTLLNFLNFFTVLLSLRLNLISFAALFTKQ